MNTKESGKLKSDLDVNYATFVATLHVGAIFSVADKEANYTAIKNKLNALGINSIETNVKEAATLIGKHVKATPVVIQVQKPPPPFDAVKALAELTAEHGHHVRIAGVEVYLDKDQAAHQPSNQPIGSRQTSGKVKFKSTIASKTWHEANTMSVMAIWANGLGAAKLANGTKEFFGQAKDEGGISYEAYCQLINGTRYVSFHCYPCRASTGDQYRG